MCGARCCFGRCRDGTSLVEPGQIQRLELRDVGARENQRLQSREGVGCCPGWLYDEYAILLPSGEMSSCALSIRNLARFSSELP